jgi:hypothetical protein
MKDELDTQKPDSEAVNPASAGSVTCGGPSGDWKEKYYELVKLITALGSAASILRDDHKKTPHCEFPRTCGGCHFWTGVVEACRDLESGDKTTIRKALAIVNSSQNKEYAEDIST